MNWDDSEVVKELKARACVLCGALVTPAHRYCGWHNFWWKMRLPYRTDTAGVFIRKMIEEGRVTK